MKCKKISLLLITLLASTTIIGCSKSQSDIQIENSKDIATIELKVNNVKLDKYKQYEEYMTNKGYKFIELDGSEKNYKCYRSVLYSQPDANDIYIEEINGVIDSIKIKIFNDIREEGFEDEFKKAVKDTLECYFDKDTLKQIKKEMSKSIDLKNKENQGAFIKFNNEISMQFTQFDSNLFFELNNTNNPIK